MLPIPPSWLPAAALGVIVTASALRMVDVARRHGVRAYGFDQDAQVQGVTAIQFRIGVIGILACALLVWLAPEAVSVLGQPAWAEAPLLRWTAAGLLTASAVLVVAAQIQMGASWRIGVPAEGPGALVARGLFAWSRNPIFVGMLGVVLGVCLWSPHIGSAAMLALAWAAIAVQVRIEEKAMRTAHGDAYEHYAAHVGRWFGRRRIHPCT